MKQTKDIVFVCKQYGTAEALWPLIEDLKKDFNCTLFAYAKASTAFALHNMPHILINSFEEARKHLDEINGNENKISNLITGTSLDDFDDMKYWQYAKKKSIPSIAYVDQWINVAGRFREALKNKVFPDVVTVVDDVIAREVRELNVPSQIVVTGSPLLYYFSQNKENFTKKNPSTSTLDCVFFAEPSLPDYKLTHGFNDNDSLLCAAGLIQKIAENKELKPKLYLKPHPIDSKERINELLALVSHLDMQIEVTQKDKYEIFKIIDMFFGMKTMALVESACLGLPTYSCQPDAKIVTPEFKNFDVQIITDKNPKLITAVTNSKTLNLPNSINIYRELLR